MSEKEHYNELQTEIDVLRKFPDQNPNPVLRMSLTGELLYFNPGATFIIQEWNVKIGDRLPEALVFQDSSSIIKNLEILIGNKTYEFKLVSVPEFRFINIYGTDVSAMKAISKFPAQNPNPVFRMSREGVLLYSNPGGKFITDAWQLGVGHSLPSELKSQINGSKNFELAVGERIYAFDIVPVEGFGFVNVYGTDITAAKDNLSILQKLSKYFSPQVYQSIFSGDLEVKIQTERKRLSVFFSDIKGFTSLTERMEPEVLTDVLTDYLTKMTTIAVKHGGTVDKYIGDAVMVFFGDPSTKGDREDALACVRMALEMKEALADIRINWTNKGIAHPLDIRIGIHTDICTVGNFGSVDRLDYTTIGNGVNLASRLESSADPNQILISDSTYLLIRDQIYCKKLEAIQVKNVSHPIQTYSVEGELGAQRHRDPFKKNMDGFSLSITSTDAGNTAEQKELLLEALAYLDRQDNG
jgi:class 3 adenylate cyclase